MSSPIKLSVYLMMLLGAVGLAMLGYNMSLPKRSVEQVVPVTLTNYLVAAHQLPAGTLARAEDFVARPLTGSIPRGAIPDTPDARTSLLGSLVRNFIDTGSPITADEVLRPRDRGFLATVLEPGTRAYSIEVNAISGVSGLIWPGDHVDVILAYEIANADAAHRTSSTTLLSDIRVIAVDQDITQGAPTNNTVAGKVAHTVALQVTPIDSEKLAAGASLGKLSLAIHAAKGEQQITAGGGVSGGDIAPGLSMQGHDVVVTVIEGSKSKDWLFKGDQHGR